MDMVEFTIDIWFNYVFLKYYQYVAMVAQIQAMQPLSFLNKHVKVRIQHC